MRAQDSPDLERKIAAMLAAWDNPANAEADQSYAELARRLIAVCLNKGGDKDVSVADQPID